LIRLFSGPFFACAFVNTQSPTGSPAKENQWHLFWVSYCLLCCNCLT